jgi:hypothetical protein
MEINYELIIKFLENTKTKLPDFCTPKSIYNYVKTFPEKFQSLLCTKAYRYGITVYNNDINISFWTSLLTLLDKNFIINCDTEELAAINKFKLELLDNYPSKYNTDKNDIKEALKLEVNYNIIQYIVDVLDINFMIFDFKTEDISLVYKNNIMNPFRPIIMFAHYLNYWEPILVNTTNNTLLLNDKDDAKNTPFRNIREFSYNDEMIRELLKYENIKYYNNMKSVLISSINVIIDHEFKAVKKTDSIFITHETIEKLDDQNKVVIDMPEKDTLSLAKLNRLTKAKLIKNATLLGITVDMSKMLKANIIDLIVNHK